MRALHTDRAPAAIGPYSQAVEAGGFLFSAGQIGLVPGTPDFAGVVKATVYLADMGEFPLVNAIYEKYFNEPYPARSTVAAAGLPKGARVEIDVVAYRS